MWAVAFADDELEHYLVQGPYETEEIAIEAMNKMVDETCEDLGGRDNGVAVIRPTDVICRVVVEEEEGTCGFNYIVTEMIPGA